MALKIVGIYKITNHLNKVYIGQSWNIGNRRRTYKSNKCEGQKKLHSSIKKYGWENHLFEIVHELPEDITQDVLDKYEILYWDLYKSCGFEMMNIKQPGVGGKHSEDTKLKMRKPKPEGFGKIVSIRQLGSKRESSSVRMKSENNPMKNKNIVARVSGKNHYMAKKVVGYTKIGDTIGIWETIVDAAKELNISTSGISRCCSGIRKTVGNYTFRYV